MAAKETEGDIVREIADGAWTRLRNLIAALDRVDRLETSREYEGWLQRLATDEQAVEQIAREFLLRALRLASDPLNSRILTALEGTEGAATTELSTATGLARTELVERLNELARAGLTVQTIEGERVEVTPLAHGVTSLVNEIAKEVVRLASNDYLLNPRAQPPKLDSHHRMLGPR
jgi:hypothetical protein